MLVFCSSFITHRKKKAIRLSSLGYAVQEWRGLTTDVYISAFGFTRDSNQPLGYNLHRVSDDNVKNNTHATNIYPLQVKITKPGWLETLFMEFSNSKSWLCQSDLFSFLPAKHSSFICCKCVQLWFGIARGEFKVLTCSYQKINLLSSDFQSLLVQNQTTCSLSDG